MNVSCEAKTYRSPKHKLLAFFEKSRNGWKAKCAAAKRKAKAWANNAAAMKRSRDRWKAIARRESTEVNRLREELEQAKNNPR